MSQNSSPDAGRELDALVAERVMGFSYTYADPSAPTLLIAVRGTDAGRSKTILKSYSTDIAAAWKVVEKLWDENFHVQFGLRHQITAGCWEAEFPTRSGPRNYVKAQAATAPHAICLAALKAVAGVRVGEPYLP